MNEQTNNWKLLTALFLALAIGNALVYLLYRLNWLGLGLGTGAGLTLWWQIKRWSAWRWSWRLPQLKRGEKLLPLLALANLLAAAGCLWAARTDAAINTPWTVVSGWIFVCWLLGFAVSAYAVWRQHPWYLAIITGQYWLSFSVAAIVYRLGFGFDPSIHQSAVSYIAEHGAVDPKTWYYAGQYGLEVLFKKLGLPLTWLDVWLLPMAATLLLPRAVKETAEKIFHDSTAIQLLPLALLSLPLGIFIVTTPQNLAYLAAILAVLAATTAEKPRDWPWIWLLAIFSLLAQPIAGLPLCLLLATWHLRQFNFPYRDWLYGILIAANAVSLPILFAFLELEPLNRNAWLQGWLNSWQIFVPQLINQKNWLLNLLYTYQSNYIWLIVALIGTGAYLMFKNGYKAAIGFYGLGLWHAAALLTAYSFSSGLSFNYLIEYERQNYSSRLLLMAAIAALPLILIALYEFLRRAWRHDRQRDYRRGFLATLGILGCFSFYAAYPRHDDYSRSGLYGLSSADLSAAQLIETDAAKQPYIVLANQQTSAAALKLYGFAHYHNNLFYYPLPTGSLLYRYFLTMNQQPQRSTAEAAMQAAGVNRLYYAISRYWWQADSLIAQAAATADYRFSADDGQVEIFVYLANTAAK